MTKSSSSFKNVVSAADRAVLEERYEFVPSQQQPPQGPTTSTSNVTNPPTTTRSTTTTTTWQDRMVQRYQEGLYREYALADLSRPGKLGLRWRTRPEVINGRGERSCGNKRCLVSSNLVTLEVPFSYVEGGVAKKELVKLNLCPTCLPLVQSTQRRPKESERTDGERRTHESLSQSDSESSSSVASSFVSSSSSSSSPSRKKKRKRKQSRQERKHRRKKSKKSKR